MKFLIFVLIVVASSVTLATDIREKIRQRTEECRQKISSIDDIESSDFNCLNACYLEKVGLMDENNKLVPDKLNMLMDSNAKSKNKKMFKDVSKDVAAKCKMTTDKDKCKAAEKIVNCLFEETKKLGFDDEVLF